MKVCGRCWKERDDDDFALKGELRQGFCKECKSKYMKRHYKKNKSAYQKRNRERKQEWARWWKELKEASVCARCPERHPACLDFHHRDPAQKSLELSVAVRNGWSKDHLLEEVAKCEVLCSNCHRKEHYTGVVQR